MNPFAFPEVASFSSDVFFDEPICVSWGCLFFHRRSFLMSHFAFFGIAYFFIGGLFDEPLFVSWGCLFFHWKSF
jgi:hypothetical protein